MSGEGDPAPTCSRRPIGQDTGLRTLKSAFESSREYQLVSVRRPTGQGAGLRSLRFRFESGRIDQSLDLRPTGQGHGCLPCEAGSIPVRSAKLRFCRGARVVECLVSQTSDSGIVTRPRHHAAEHDWSSASSFKRVIAGSLPVCGAKFGSEALTAKQSALNR